jgi:hypothetical protein
MNGSSLSGAGMERLPHRLLHCTLPFCHTIPTQIHLSTSQFNHNFQNAFHYSCLSADQPSVVLPTHRRTSRQDRAELLGYDQAFHPQQAFVLDSSLFSFYPEWASTRRPYQLSSPCSLPLPSIGECYGVFPVTQSGSPATSGVHPCRSRPRPATP